METTGSGGQMQSSLRRGNDCSVELTTPADVMNHTGNKLCAWRHNIPPPLQVDNIFAFIRQVAVLFRHNNSFVFIRQVAPVPACWLFKT